LATLGIQEMPGTHIKDPGKAQSSSTERFFWQGSRRDGEPPSNARLHAVRVTRTPPRTC